MLIAINLIMTIVMAVLIGVIFKLPDYIVKLGWNKPKIKTLTRYRLNHTSNS